MRNPAGAAADLPEHELVTRLTSALAQPNATFGELLGAVQAAKAELDLFRALAESLGSGPGEAGQSAMLAPLSDKELRALAAAAGRR